MTALQKQALAEIEAGNTTSVLLREVAGSDTFPNALGNQLHKRALDAYKTKGLWWEDLAQIIPAKDFKEIHATRMGTLEKLLETKEGQAYKKSALKEEKETYSVKKYGRIFPVTWESLVNDDLGIISRAVSKWGLAAKRTENERISVLYDKATTLLMGDGSACITVGCTVANKTTVGLTATGLTSGITLMRTQVDMAGNPVHIDIRGVSLVIPPAMDVTATELVVNVVKVGASNSEINVFNRYGMKIVENPYFTAITNGFLVADKRECPVLEVAYLYGNREPEMRTSSPDAGANFESDVIEYRLRLVFEPHFIDRRGIVLLAS